MSAPAIFVSHSHQDDEYCHTFVTMLRAAGLDVWYDEHNATAGHLVDLIEREIRQRPVFILILTPAALASTWVKDECTWAYGRWRKDQAGRVMLPVLAASVDEDNIWLFMQEFKRIEQPGLRPWPVDEAARRAAFAVHPNSPLSATSAIPQSAVSSHADEAEALIAAGNTLVSIGKRADAIDMFRRATQVDPRSVTAWNQLGYYLEYDSYHEAGLQAFERALKLDPRNALSWAGKAETLAWLGRPQEALPAAEMALRLDPNLAYAHNGKGVALYSFHRYAEAILSYDRATALDSSLAPAWNNKGVALSSLGRHKEALSAYERALAIEPTATRWSGKGNALNNLGRYQEALSAFECALALAPRANAWNGKGNALVSLKRFQEAIDAYDQALVLIPNDIVVWRNKAAALRKLGRTAEADAAERKATELEKQGKR